MDSAIQGANQAHPTYGDHPDGDSTTSEFPESDTSPLGGDPGEGGESSACAAVSQQEGNPETSAPRISGAVEGPALAVPETRPLQAWVQGPRDTVQSACDADTAPQSSDLTSDGASPLDTLGKSRQGGVESSSDRRPTPGEEDREKMRKRARSKYITSGLLNELESLDSPVPYSKARHCCERVEQRDGKLTSHYCRSRWCIICNRIRAGVRINRYVPVFEEWDQDGGVQFVTLTVPNCEGEDLRGTLGEMLHQLKLCRRQLRRTRGLEYKAVRSIEVTYNSNNGTFHPHFHIAVCSRSAAIALRDEWLKRWDEASRAAQDVTAWDGDTGSLKELVKYPTKLMTTTEGKEQPDPEALDTIFRALKGKHLFEPVGFQVADYHEDLDPSVDLDEFEDQEAVIAAFHRPRENVVWMWDADAHDWVDHETGECLTGWDPTLLDRSAARTRGDP